MDDIYENIEEYKSNKKLKILIAFNDVIADIKNLDPMENKLFMRVRKLNISLVFITYSYFAVPKTIRLNSTHYFIMKISNKGELQKMTFNHSSNIDFQDFVNLFFFLNVLQNHILFSYWCYSRFRKNLLEII